MTKRNANQSTMVRTQSRGAVSLGLEGVRLAAMRSKETEFTALLHHVTYDLLYSSFKRLRKSAAVGIDGKTWAEYNSKIEKNIDDLLTRLHRGSYRAMPSLRTFIPKPDGGQRPLGIASLEDKIVQKAVKTVLNQIYEVDFKKFSYGFRTDKKAHDALDALYVGITNKKISWVLDADIQKYFDSINHDWMMEFLRHRIKDKRILRLVHAWLKAGVIEATEWKETEEGSPQGAVISPLLANIFLHYVLDDWVDWWRRTRAKGDVIFVRYADDFVLGFQYRFEAEAFLEALKIRLGQFSLTLHPTKTRLIEFGRFAASNRKGRGEGKPETFDFLGFTHFCSRFRKGGFAIRRITINKRFRAKLKQVRRKMWDKMHEEIADQGRWLRSVILGYQNYQSVPGNLRTLIRFRGEILRAWIWTLRRRSQKGRKLTWAAFRRIYRRWIPFMKEVHPWPWVRFNAIYLR